MELIAFRINRCIRAHEGANIHLLAGLHAEGLNQPVNSSTLWDRILRVFVRPVAWVLIALLTLWAAVALIVDCRVSPLRIPLAAIYLVASFFIVVRVKSRRRKILALLICWCVVLGWWLSLKPTNQANWQENVSRTAWAEFSGNLVSIHNFRECDYRTENDYTHCWSDRTFDLSQIRGVDLFLTNWGLKYVSHPILSFDFGNNEHVAFSIEVRYKVGQSYSAFRGFFRQFELIFITADERDVIRLRTNFRKGEEVYLYRTRAVPATARAVFLTYVRYLNTLRDHPEWYNALARNCTTTLNRQIAKEIPDRKPWNYEIILNGTLDKLLYDRDRLVTEGLSFSELKQREHINAAAQAIQDLQDYPEIVRRGRVGF